MARDDRAFLLPLGEGQDEGRQLPKKILSGVICSLNGKRV